MIEKENLIKRVVANPRSGKPRGQNFKLKFKKDKKQFVLSKELYARLDMDDKGFTNYVDPNTGEVFISVQAKEDSVFYRASKGKVRAMEFKNAALADDLIASGLDNEKLDLQHVKNFKDSMLYKVVPDPDIVRVAPFSAEKEINVLNDTKTF